jgi:hypothetical protein
MYICDHLKPVAVLMQFSCERFGCSWSNWVIKVTKLLAGWPRDELSTSSRINICLISIIARPVLGTPSLSYKDADGSLLGIKQLGHKTHLILALRLVMHGVVPPLPTMPLWHSTSSSIFYPCKIWGFHSGDYEEWCLLGWYAVWLL